MSRIIVAVVVCVFTPLVLGFRKDVSRNIQDPTRSRAESQLSVDGARAKTGSRNSVDQTHTSALLQHQYVNIPTEYDTKDSGVEPDTGRDDYDTGASWGSHYDTAGSWGSHYDTGGSWGSHYDTQLHLTPETLGSIEHEIASWMGSVAEGSWNIPSMDVEVEVNVNIHSRASHGSSSSFPWGSYHGADDGGGSYHVTNGSWGSYYGTNGSWGSYHGADDGGGSYHVTNGSWGSYYGTNGSWGSYHGADGSWGSYPIFGVSNGSWGSHHGANDGEGSYHVTNGSWGSHHGSEDYDSSGSFAGASDAAEKQAVGESLTQTFRF